MFRIRRLWLRTFRNYALADLALAEGVTVFVGPNGQGKSNLLEAAYMVSTGRSHRTGQEAEVIQRGATAARVRAAIARRGREEELEVTVALEDGRGSVRMRLNGAPSARGAVLGRLPVVLAAPWDLELVRGGGAGRRRLMDAALAQLSPAYFFALHRYHRVVIQRNAVLRGRVGPRATGLEPWDAQLVALGVRITAHRAAYVERLRGPAADWFGRLGGAGTLEARYRPSWTGQGDETLAAAGRAQLAQRRADELRRGLTLVGPHRDDLELLLDGVPLRATGSQGQWRTAMLAMRLAERDVMAADLGARPVLLLDDALAELDPERQRRVLDVDGEGQVLATATALPEAATSARVIAVRAGTLEEAAWSPRSATS
ncbi:MAG: DNA replication and repair protein RecF [Armatimonadota bacterium]|nr:DNA replication and repair protein RecF [Armatimonadota bacterium]